MVVGINASTCRLRPPSDRAKIDCSSRRIRTLTFEPRRGGGWPILLTILSCTKLIIHADGDLTMPICFHLHHDLVHDPSASQTVVSISTLNVEKII